MKIEKDDWLNETLELAKNWVFGVGIITGLVKISRDDFFSAGLGRLSLLLILFLGVLIVSFASYKFSNNVFCFDDAKKGHFSKRGLCTVIAAFFSAMILTVSFNHAVSLEMSNNSVLNCSGQITVLYK